jgi:hypothetical protein
MANYHKVTQLVAMRPLAILKATNQFLPSFNTDYNSEFNKEYPTGQGFDVKFPFRFITRTGQRREERDVNRKTTRVEMADPIGIDFAWNDFEEAVNMEKGEDSINREFLDPAGQALGTALGLKMAEEAYLRCPNIVGALGTDPTSVNTYSSSQAKMAEYGVQPGEQRAYITPSMADTLRRNLTTLTNPANSISDMFREGSMGKMYGANFFETVLLKQHTTGIVTAKASVTVNGNVAQGATSVTVNCTSGDTFKRGERIAFAASYWVHPDTRQRFGTGTANLAVYIVQQDVTATTTTCTLNLDRPIWGPGSEYQNVDALPLNAAAVTIWPGTTITDGQSVTGTVGLRLHRGALALVGVKMSNPKAVELAKQMRDPDTGLAVSVVAQFDIEERKNKARMDVWPGFGSFYTANDAVCILGA